uniref:Uncharacterized protein n=1 Tax=Rhizophora mucronata TaxID=61149 RepID=A0A2P2JK74_RHIMU
MGGKSFFSLFFVIFLVMLFSMGLAIQSKCLLIYVYISALIKISSISGGYVCGINHYRRHNDSGEDKHEYVMVK